MRTPRILLALVGGTGLLTAGLLLARKSPPADKQFVSYTADPRRQHLQLYWQDEQGRRFGSLQNLKLWLSQHRRQLVFAMNAGMYRPDHAPQGLYIENGQTLAPLDTGRGPGNFYLRPNGVFYLTASGAAAICPARRFPAGSAIKYATQSGPLLLIDGQIHPAFRAGSANRNIRNGVGILPNNRVLFAMSKKEINFYDFARYFQRRGCRDALYLDGLVSRTYLPAKQWAQTDGDFGVIIGVSKAVK